MERELTYKEKNKINEMCNTEMTLAVSYGNIAKIIAPIFTILIFLFLYFEISWGSIWIYLGIGILLAIIEIFELSKLQAPFISLKNNDCSCIESPMLSSRRKIRRAADFVNNIEIPGEVRHYNYYVTVKIAEEIKEIQYKGNSFNFLTIGEQMLIVHSKKNNSYICFSNKEINI